MDPKWLYRAGLAVVVVAFIVLVARMTILGLKPDPARMERSEAAALGKAPPPAPPKH